jgi:hypothetical protein
MPIGYITYTECHRIRQIWEAQWNRPVSKKNFGDSAKLDLSKSSNFISILGTAILVCLSVVCLVFVLH